MSIASVQQQLSTPEGFSKTVSAKRGVFVGAIACLIVGVFCIGMNLFQLGTASDWEWRLIGRFFFDANAVEFSGSRSNRSEVWRYIYVFLPLIAIPAGIVLIILHITTRNKSAAGLFNDFQTRGWVGRQRDVGLKVENGNAHVDVNFVSHPSIADDVFTGAVQHYTSFLAGLDKKGMNDVKKSAVKAGVLKGVDASALMPGAPAGLIAAPAQGKGEFVIVVPPAPGASGKLRIFAIKSAALSPSFGSENAK